jgi:LPXTG-motif cell wall-anchored protein
MRTLIAAVAVVATATVGLAQNADKNSAGPTKNDYRLRVVEPREGATVTGGTVRVVVDTRIPAEVGDEKRDVNSMPRPRIDVFVDNTNVGTLEADQNVLEVPNVNTGAHKLVLVAKNQSSEIIDRKEINFSSTEAVASATTSNTSATTSSTNTYTAPPPAPAPAPPPPAPASTYTAPSTAPSSTYTAPSTTYQAPPPARSTRKTLPKTGTSDGLVAISGLGLLAAGYALRRRLS